MAKVIIGIGTDIVEIGRIRKAAENPRFLLKHFSVQERALFEEKKDAAPSIANNFAAKEAFSKALGTGVRGFALSEVAILRDALGAPVLTLSGRAAEIAAERGVTAMHVSLSNTDEYAVAFVVLEG